MRKQEKKLAKDFLALLSSAHGEVKLALEKGWLGQAAQLLEQCQQGAEELGGLIESAEGEGFVTVGLLEGYCELVYQVYRALEEADPAVIFGRMEGKLKEIEASVERDIRLRREAVFLPYKASMWDSLESVWRAADADPDCDAYVVPIPYYNRTEDGRPGTYHYEGGLYPKDVPVVHYNAYSIEKRRPDMIFIHNPYDGSNYITAVDPFYYAKNLKQYTDLLVYIPYFVLEEFPPEDTERVKSIEHFCRMPGVLHSDLTFVQSENMRQIYLDVLSRHTGEETRGDWEKRIVASGSPKSDKVRSTREEDCQIPADWQRLIRRPDGGKKKVVFYNISLLTVLNTNETNDIFRKLRDVFHVFKARQDEVVLLWRPHPLIQESIQSMRPQLQKEYAALVQAYREEGWGIYDGSPDLNRAIAVSDAYYGDGSSVAFLFREVGKPVLIQNIALLAEQGAG